MKILHIFITMYFLLSTLPMFSMEKRTSVDLGKISEEYNVSDEASVKEEEKEVLKTGLNYSTIQKYEQYPEICKIIRDDNVDELKKFLEEHKNFNVKTNIGLFGNDTCLSIAAKMNSTKVLDALLSMDKSIVDDFNNYGETPLYLAVAHYNRESVKILIDYGANPLKNTTRRKRPIALAIENKNLAIVKYLIDSALNAPSLMLAIDLFKVYPKASEEIVWLILTEAQEKSIDLVKEIINTPNDDGETPLLNAVERIVIAKSQKHGLINLLLSKGYAQPSINKANNIGWTPLAAATKGKDLEVVKILLVNGAQESLFKKNDKGHTPLLIAIKNNNTDIVDYLINADSSFNIDSLLIATNNGDIPLVAALSEFSYAPQASKKIVTAILKKAQSRGDKFIKKIVNTANNNGETPLLIAVKGAIDSTQTTGKYDVVEMLLAGGLANPSLNKADKNGITPLALAITHYKQDAYLILLLSYLGATLDPQIKNKRGYNNQIEEMVSKPKKYCIDNNLNYITTFDKIKYSDAKPIKEEETNEVKIYTDH